MNPVRLEWWCELSHTFLRTAKKIDGEWTAWLEGGGVPVRYHMRGDLAKHQRQMTGRGEVEALAVYDLKHQIEGMICYKADKSSYNTPHRFS